MMEVMGSLGRGRMGTSEKCYRTWFKLKVGVTPNFKNARVSNCMKWMQYIYSFEICINVCHRPVLGDSETPWGEKTTISCRSNGRAGNK